MLKSESCVEMVDARGAQTFALESLMHSFIQALICMYMPLHPEANLLICSCSVLFTVEAVWRHTSGKQQHGADKGHGGLTRLGDSSSLRFCLWGACLKTCYYFLDAAFQTKHLPSVGFVLPTQDVPPSSVTQRRRHKRCFKESTCFL